MQQRHSLPFIVDANVLIDYCDSDLNILSLLSMNVSVVHIGRSTFNKVGQLKEAEAKKHDLVIVTPDLALATVASQDRGSLAYDDRETLLLAKKHGWICITNDKPLRRECKIETVPSLWGLEPMKILLQRRIIRLPRAVAVARKIKTSNPSFITNNIIDRFEKQVHEILGEVRRRE